MRFRNLPILVAGVAAAVSSRWFRAPPNKSFATSDYARAEKFMGYNTTPLVSGPVCAQPGCQTSDSGTA